MNHTHTSNLKPRQGFCTFGYVPETLIDHLVTVENLLYVSCPIVDSTLGEIDRMGDYVFIASAQLPFRGEEFFFLGDKATIEGYRIKDVSIGNIIEWCDHRAKDLQGATLVPPLHTCLVSQWIRLSIKVGSGHKYNDRFGAILYGTTVSER